MSTTRCRAKNPATCRVHGGSSIDFTTGKFLREPSSFTEHHQKSEWFQLMLSEEERRTVTDYLNQDYVAINAHMHTGNGSPRVIRQAKVLSDVVARYEAVKSEPKTVYRSSRVYDAGLKSAAEVAPFMRERFVPGETFTFEGVTSTTENPGALFDFLQPGYADSPRKSMFGPKDEQEWVELFGGQAYEGVVFEIQTTRGAPVSAFGQTYAEKEQEWLLKPGTSYQIAEVVPYTPVEHEGLVGGYPQTNRRHVTVVRLIEQ